MPPKKPPGLYDVIVTTVNRMRSPTPVLTARFDGLPARAAARRAIEAVKTTPDATVRAHIVPTGYEGGPLPSAPWMTCRRGARDAPHIAARQHALHDRFRQHPTPDGAVIRLPVTCTYTPTSATRVVTTLERELKQKPRRRGR